MTRSLKKQEAVVFRENEQLQLLLVTLDRDVAELLGCLWDILTEFCVMEKQMICKGSRRWGRGLEGTRGGSGVFSRKLPC